MPMQRDFLPDFPPSYFAFFQLFDPLVQNSSRMKKNRLCEHSEFRIK